MNIEIKLEKPLKNSLTKENYAELEDFDLLIFYPENQKTFIRGLEERKVAFWFDEEYLVVGTNIYEEKPGFGSFWRISEDRKTLTYNHVESM